MKEPVEENTKEVERLENFEFGEGEPRIMSESTLSFHYHVMGLFHNQQILLAIFDTLKFLF